MSARKRKAQRAVKRTIEGWNDLRVLEPLTVERAAELLEQLDDSTKPNITRDQSRAALMKLLELAQQPDMDSVDICEHGMVSVVCHDCAGTGPDSGALAIARRNPGAQACIRGSTLIVLSDSAHALLAEVRRLQQHPVASPRAWTGLDNPFASLTQKEPPK